VTLTLAAPVIAAVLIGAVALILRLQRTHQVRLHGRTLRGDSIGVASLELPAVIHFTSATCTVCHVAQRPALQRLSEIMSGAVAIHEVDVAEHREAVRRFRVMSLPTTVLLSAEGQVIAINSGFTPSERIQSQLESAGIRARATAAA
jgi:thioredoxin-like negative regulator of GroEL